MFVNEFAGVPEGSVQLKMKSEAKLFAREKVTPSVTEYTLGLTKVVTAWAEKVRVVKSRTTHAGIRRREAEDLFIKIFLVRVGGLSNGGGMGGEKSEFWISNFGFWIGDPTSSRMCGTSKGALKGRV
jgi:hypothetical protein